MCNILNAQGILTEVIKNGNTLYLDNLLNVEQINDFTAGELRILRNTFYAKYGYKFISTDLINHFTRFTWYTGNKTNVSNELTENDWKNIKLIQILESYYPTKIDYIFNIQHTGIYKINKNFILTPVYTDINAPYKEYSSFVDYIQLNDFIFFDGSQTQTLFYDYLTNYFYYIEDYITDIISIYYKSKNELIIYALSYAIYRSDDNEKIYITLNLPDGVIKNEMIGKTFYKADKINYKEIYNGNTYITNKGIYNYFHPEWYIDKDVKEHLFSAFDKNIIVILENSYPYIFKENIYPEHLGIKILYNNKYDIYFLLVQNYGYMTR